MNALTKAILVIISVITLAYIGIAITTTVVATKIIDTGLTLAKKESASKAPLNTETCPSNRERRIAITEHELGQPMIAYLEETRDCYLRNGAVSDAAETLGQIAAIHKLFGKNEEAIKALEQAQRLAPNPQWTERISELQQRMSK